MTNSPESQAGFAKFAQRARKPIRISADSLVTTGALPGAGELPIVIGPAVSHVDLIEWAKMNRDFIEARLLAHGAILFRGFGIASSESFEAFALASSTGGLLDYTYASTPRTRLSGGIYTSTEYPADQTIPPHNEMSYSSSWPLKIWFCCLKGAVAGGATPIADSARVYDRIAPEVRKRFIERGVMYVRNYGSVLDLPLGQVFGTEDRNEIESLCTAAGIEAHWRGDRLRTREVCQAAAVHPKSGRNLWFNQAHLFHISSLGPALAGQLLAEFGQEELPRNAYFADGSSIGEDDLDQVRQAYCEELISFRWQEGDILMVDNMAVAHAREPYSGERKVVVAMAEQYGAGLAQRPAQ